MANKASIKGFLDWCTPHALRMTNVLPYEKQINPANQWGYIFGWRGKVASSGKWKGRQCFDCNGLAEGYLDKILGGNHDTRSRYNFSIWCAGHNGADMRMLPQIPGTAVFRFNPVVGYIEHVGYLWRKFGTGKFDWLVVEAANGDKGVIISKFHSGWNRWGIMDSVFEYDTTDEPLPETLPVLKRGSTNRPAIRKMQIALNTWYNLNVDSTFDADDESVLKRFQKVHRIPQTGVCDENTWYYLLN